MAITSLEQESTSAHEVDANKWVLFRTHSRLSRWQLVQPACINLSESSVKNVKNVLRRYRRFASPRPSDITFVWKKTLFLHLKKNWSFRLNQQRVLYCEVSESLKVAMKLVLHQQIKRLIVKSEEVSGCLPNVYSLPRLEKQWTWMIIQCEVVSEILIVMKYYC